MMFNPPLRRLFLLLAFLSANQAFAAGAAPAVAPLRPVKEPQKIDQEWRQHICALEGIVCNSASERLPESAVQLYRVHGDQDGRYYFMSAGDKVLSRLQYAHSQWSVDAVWDFRRYGPTNLKIEGASEEPPTYLASALFPTAPQQWAVAIVSRASTMYSGGGADCEVADFVELPPHSAVIDSGKRLYSGVPFSDSVMIRACFTEKEYRQKGHCHDETDSILLITPRPVGGNLRYDWDLTWKTTDWPSGVPQSKATITCQRVTLTPSDSAEQQEKKLAPLAVCTGIQ